MFDWKTNKDLGELFELLQQEAGQIKFYPNVGEYVVVMFWYHGLWNVEEWYNNGRVVPVYKNVSLHGALNMAKVKLGLLSEEEVL